MYSFTATEGKFDTINGVSEVIASRQECFHQDGWTRICELSVTSGNLVLFDFSALEHLEAAFHERALVIPTPLGIVSVWTPVGESADTYCTSRWRIELPQGTEWNVISVDMEVRGCARVWMDSVVGCGDLEEVQKRRRAQDEAEAFAQMFGERRPWALLSDTVGPFLAAVSIRTPKEEARYGWDAVRFDLVTPCLLECCPTALYG